MLPPLDATPCPTSIPSDRNIDLRSFGLRKLDYDTSKIDFTTDFRSSPRIAGLKHRPTMTRPKRLGGNTGFSVHHEKDFHNKDHGNPGNSRHPIPTGDKPSILAQPAQRPRSKAAFALAPTNSNPALPKHTTATAVTSNSRQIEPISNTEGGAQSLFSKTMGHNFFNIDESVKRPARRGTVYIPSEDTTMPTVWMGVFSPIKDLPGNDENIVGHQSAPADLTGLAAKMVEKRVSKKSSVMEAPRRAPLEHSWRPPQETTITEDIPGQSTGKENIPPGYEIMGKKKSKKVLGESSRQHHQPARRPTFDIIKKHRLSSCGPENPTSKNGCPSQPVRAGEICNTQAQANRAVPKHSIISGLSRLRLSEGDKELSLSARSGDALMRNPRLSSSGRIETAPAKIIVPKVAAPPAEHAYPVLSENIQTPSLYENNWLAYQEIAITQLVNNLFNASNRCSDIANDCTTRSKLMIMYQDHSFVILQNRLQASLLFGSLHLPKEIIAKSSRLADDLGMKQSFLNLWLNTYNLRALQSCAEVVIGRQCVTSPRNSSTAQASTISAPRKVSRQTLSIYLDKFLIRNEDSALGEFATEGSVTGVQRTLLRSLMLMQLLDQAKISPDTPFPGCLFQPTSQHKSSEAVILALGQMLNPAVGNIIRSLHHLNYSVSHIQYPLEEYDYHIHNLAVDLRDGVKLTRLIEQLLYPTASRHISYAGDGDTTATITMPTGEVLSLPSNDSNQEWPLSQYLKFPCLGRATKIYNVQIALSALEGVKGVGKIVENVQAEDIVDGFREKTVALLWGLVSKWGLASLVNWVDLKTEICRLGGTVGDDDGDESDGFKGHANALAEQKYLLKQWASAAAAYKGLEVHNLSTSFAGGKVFEAIVDQYEPYIHSVSNTGDNRANTLPTKAPRHLSQRLAALGCSAQFASLFSPESAPKIFDTDFTLASLSFLASRLLSASRYPRAAVTIQRAWRNALKQREVEKKKVLGMLAGQCKAVVDMRAEEEEKSV